MWNVLISKEGDTYSVCIFSVKCDLDLRSVLPIGLPVNVFIVKSYRVSVDNYQVMVFSSLIMVTHESHRFLLVYNYCIDK